MTPSDPAMNTMIRIYERWQEEGMGIDFPPTSHEEAFCIAAEQIERAIAAALRERDEQHEKWFAMMEEALASTTLTDFAKLTVFSIALGSRKPLSEEEIAIATKFAKENGLMELAKKRIEAAGAATAEPTSVAPLCGHRNPLKDKGLTTPFLCELEAGHSGNHEARCDNAQFTERW